jgi:hypothetical protein
MTAGKAAVREQGRSARLPGQGHRDLLSARCPPALPGHRMRNLAAKVPEDVWPEFKGRVQAAHQAPSRAIARELAAGVVADYGREQERGVACFMDDFEACIARACCSPLRSEANRGDLKCCTIRNGRSR